MQALIDALIDRVLLLSKGVAIKTTLTDSDKADIEQLYSALLHKPFITRQGCNDCYRDAIIEIKIYLKQKTMTYQLKNGALIYDHPTNTYYTNANLTDSVAARMLSDNPAIEDQFAVIGKAPDATKAPTQKGSAKKAPAIEKSAPDEEPEIKSENSSDETE